MDWKIARTLGKHSEIPSDPQDIGEAQAESLINRLVATAADLERADRILQENPEPETANEQSGTFLMEAIDQQSGNLPHLWMECRGDTERFASVADMVFGMDSGSHIENDEVRGSDAIRALRLAQVWFNAKSEGTRLMLSAAGVAAHRYETEITGKEEPATVSGEDGIS